MLTERVEDAVRLLRETPHQYRYTFRSGQEMRAFITQVEAGLASDAGRLRWRRDGVTDAEPAAVLWLAGEPPAPFA